MNSENSIRSDYPDQTYNSNHIHSNTRSDQIGYLPIGTDDYRQDDNIDSMGNINESRIFREDLKDEEEFDNIQN